MKYYLKNIAQNSLARTIFLGLAGLSMWIVSFVSGNGVVTGLIGIGLVLLNSLLMTYCVRRVGWTNLPSSFVIASVWLILSALSVWQLCWQVHVVALLYIVVTMVFARMNIQHEAKEQAYILTLICCVFSPQLILTVATILYILVYLLTRSNFTWRVLVAMLMAIGTYVLYATILRYMGWWKVIWLENLPILAWQWWVIGLGSYLVLCILLYLPLKRPSVVSGTIYIIGMIAAIMISGLKFIL